MSYTYTDASMHRIDVETKEIDNPSHQPLIVGEALSHYIPFEISSCEIDGIDVTGMNISVVWWHDATKEKKEDSVINVQHIDGDEFFSFGWVLDGNTALKPGTLYFYVRISDGRGYEWRTLDAKKKVVTSKIWEASEDGDIVPDKQDTVSKKIEQTEKTLVELRLTDHIQYREVEVDGYVEASVYVKGATGYRWQYSDDMTSWSNSTSAGYDTDTISIKGVKRYNGRYYRCIVTTSDGQVITGLAKINVREKEDLSQSGGVTKEELSDLAEPLDAVIRALSFSNPDFTETTEYKNFRKAWGLDTSDEPVYPPTPTRTLQSITATYQGGEVEEGTPASSLTGITVIGHYNISPLSQVVTGWSISGVVGVGSNTFVITYGGKTTTITVVGVASDVPVEIVRPVVPQTGTWQLKTTPSTGFLFIGTDDDNGGNANFFRLLRSYGFPYSMNVEAENVGSSPAMLGTDTDSRFLSNDAPSLFPSNVSVVELGKYLHSSGLGEVSMHGLSRNTLWDSDKLTGTFFDGLYDTYVAGGGGKSKDELRQAIMIEKASTDVRQHASYVEHGRNILEQAFGFAINTVGIWGGSPDVMIDGITLNLNEIKNGSNYPWREDNFIACNTKLSTGYTQNPWDMNRRTSNNLDEMINLVDNIPVASPLEIFWHVPFNDFGGTDSFNNMRTLFDYIKSKVDAGLLKVIKKSDYYYLGEFVQNPIASISVSTKEERYISGTIITESDIDCIVTYEDGTFERCKSDRIIDLSAVGSDKGRYSIRLLYRGFTATGTVEISESTGEWEGFVPEYIGGDIGWHMGFPTVTTNGVMGWNENTTGQYFTTDAIPAEGLEKINVNCTYTSNNGTMPKITCFYAKEDVKAGAKATKSDTVAGEGEYTFIIPSGTRYVIVHMQCNKTYAQQFKDGTIVTWS